MRKTNMEFGLRQHIYQGPGCAETVKDILARENWKRVLFVCEPILYQTGAVTYIEDYLKETGAEVAVFTNIRPNPEAETIDKEGVPLALEFKPDVVVALGGGSTIDSAKAIAIIGDSGKTALDFVIMKFPPGSKVEHNTLPLIVLPSTAGTGSEVCQNAVVSDSSGLKLVMVHDAILPKYALLDPNLLKTMPASVAAATAMDTFVQALETYTNRNANDFTRTQSLRSLELVGKYIKAYVANPADAEAANGISLACMYAGFSLGHAGIGQDHILSHPFSEDPFYIAHGDACAMLLPAVIEFNGLSCKELYKNAYNALTGENLTSAEFEVQYLVDWVVTLNSDIHVCGDKSISERGYVEEVHLEKIMQHPVVQGALAFSSTADSTEFPRHTTADDFRYLVRRTVIYSQAQADLAKARQKEV